VPTLLDGLAMPIEGTVIVRSDRMGNSHYLHSLYQEGRDKDRAEDASYFSIQNRNLGRDYVYRRHFHGWEDRTRVTAEQVANYYAAPRRSLVRFNENAATLVADVSNANQATEALNSRIIPVLKETTEKNYSVPTQWWKWWSDSNEYYSDDHPVEYQYYSGTDNHYLGLPHDRVSIDPSCFVKGTPVWTKTGQRPVESIEVGDLVLSQDVNSGELKYQPVVARTVRPPSEIVKISVDGEELRATRGHPFWVAGVGWRMAKELGDGAKLHGLTSASIGSVATDDKAEAYNLVVAEFGTYFVGQHGFLVHDNTARRPTQSILPGIRGTSKK
jgi:pretoxin HINT domain-containing protein